MTRRTLFASIAALFGARKAAAAAKPALLTTVRVDPVTRTVNVHQYTMEYLCGKGWGKTAALQQGADYYRWRMDALARAVNLQGPEARG